MIINRLMTHKRAFVFIILHLNVWIVCRFFKMNSLNSQQCILWHQQQFWRLFFCYHFVVTRTHTIHVETSVDSNLKKKKTYALAQLSHRFVGSCNMLSPWTGIHAPIKFAGDKRKDGDKEGKQMWNTSWSTQHSNVVWIHFDGGDSVFFFFFFSFVSSSFCWHII